MPRLGMWSISSDRLVGAIRLLQLMRFGRYGLRLSTWLRRADHPFQMVVFATAIVLACVGCKGDSSAATKPTRGGQEASTTREVKVTSVIAKALERSMVALGSLAAFDQATVSAKVPGRLRSITVDLGSVVQQGQLIAQIDPQDYQLRIQQADAALAQARARLGLPSSRNSDRLEPAQTSIVRQARALLEEAKTNRDRQVALFEQGIVARSQLDSADASYKVALSRYEDAIEEVRNREALVAQRRSELALARQQLDDSAIYAPFDGAIQEKRASIGEYLGAGAPIATVVRMNPLRLRAEVPEREAQQVRIGQSVRVTTEGDPNVYLGRIARLSPIITPQTRMLVVEAEVMNEGSLRPGLFARAEIVVDENSPALAVPTKSVVTFAGIEKVIVVQNGKAIEKSITTRRRTGEWTEVVSGINVGELIVIEPGNLQSGQPVTIVE
ncbi:MAG TPA: efflux RND transporter periplasmic adaptor subunit [Candidatus Tectomicrobia bacterium]